MSNRKPEHSWQHISENLDWVRRKVTYHAERADRDPETVKIIAVSKTIPVAGIQAAISFGQQQFGENRMQDALPKITALKAPSAEFHMVGRLQTNKAKLALTFDMIESVDSVRIAEALNRHAVSPMEILLEVNVSGEKSKFGIQPEKLLSIAKKVRMFPNLNLTGLMTVAPLVSDPEEVRPVFHSLRTLGDTCGLDILSMGMTNDFGVAIEEGATIIRIGRAIFGQR